jgi:hypothetical protein
MKIGGRGGGKTHPLNPPIVWRMTHDERAAFNPYASYTALGVKSIAHMGHLVFSNLSVREAALASAGHNEWKEMGLPFIVIVVDADIDIGELAEAVRTRGHAVGMSLVMLSKDEE